MLRSDTIISFVSGSAVKAGRFIWLSCRGCGPMTDYAEPQSVVAGHIAELVAGIDNGHDSFNQTRWPKAARRHHREHSCITRDRAAQTPDDAYFIEHNQVHWYRYDSSILRAGQSDLYM